MNKEHFFSTFDIDLVGLKLVLAHVIFLSHFRTQLMGLYCCDGKGDCCTLDLVRWPLHLPCLN